MELKDIKNIRPVWPKDYAAIYTTNDSNTFVDTQVYLIGEYYTEQTYVLKVKLVRLNF